MPSSSSEFSGAPRYDFFYSYFQSYYNIPVKTANKMVGHLASFLPPQLKIRQKLGKRDKNTTIYISLFWK
jgi:hypothetical protein